MSVHDAVVKFIVIVCLATPLESSVVHAEDDFQKLKGKWRATTFIADGVDSSDVIQREDALWVFDPPFVRLMHHGVEVRFRTTFDSESTPKQFDAQYIGDNPYFKKQYAPGVQGIYEIRDNGNELRRCYPIESGRPRPVEFDAKRGSGNVIIILERINAGDENKMAQ